MVTVNVPAEPTAKVAWSALVIAPGPVTVRVNAWVDGPGAVGGGERERVRAAGTRGRRAGQGRGAVAVVGERHPGRQRAGLGDRGGGREPGRGGHREGAGRADREGGVVGAGDRRQPALTVSVNVCVASGTDAVAGGDGERVVPPVPAAGVPARVAVPSPLSVKVTPDGRVPVSVEVVGAGTPGAVVTVNEPGRADREGGVVGAGDVGRAVSFTVSVKVWVASGRRRCWP